MKKLTILSTFVFSTVALASEVNLSPGASIPAYLTADDNKTTLVTCAAAPDTTLPLCNLAAEGDTFKVTRAGYVLARNLASVEEAIAKINALRASALCR